MSRPFLTHLFVSPSVVLNSSLFRYVVPPGVRGHLQGGYESAGESQASDPTAWQPGVHSGLHQDHAAQPGPGADGENNQPG